MNTAEAAPHPATVMAMALVVAADDDGRAAELSTALALQEGLDAMELTSQVAKAEADAEAAWAAFDAAAAPLGPDERENVMCKAIKICMADADLADGEIAVLSRLGRSLELPVTRVRELMRSAFRSSLQG